MMTDPVPPAPMADRLYELLPGVHRLRDGQHGEQLRALLQVVGEQLQLVEDDINGLYDNWFVETCADWAIPYLGDLVGYVPTGVAAALEDPRGDAGRGLVAAVFPRRAVANVVRARRRKGTLALLEELAADVGGWPARAVEFYRLLGVSQPVHLLGTGDAVPRVWCCRGRTVDVRDGEAIDLAEGPFGSLAHSVDVRRPTSRRTTGRYGIPSVGLFAWRLRPYSVTDTPARSLEDEDPHRYSFSVLGNNAPLFARPVPERTATDIAGEANLPVPIRRRALERNPDKFVGPGRSFQVRIGDPPELVPADHVVAADLGPLRHRPRRGRVLVDPERGLMLFAHDLLSATRAGVCVSYSYGFSADIGGGEYDRPLPGHPGAVVTRVRGKAALDRALAGWRDGATPAEQPRHAVIEIDDSGVYDVAVHLEVGAGSSLQLRAGERRRPVIRLSDRSTGMDALRVSGGAGSRFGLDGLMVVGNAVQVDGDLAGLTIRHCTLVPGWGLGPDCEPTHPARPSLELIDTRPDVCVEHSIVGSIQVTMSEVRSEPVRLCVSDSILDATSRERAALSALGGGRAHATAALVRTTVFGTVTVQAISLAENSILEGRVDAARRQTGCVRFCSVLPNSRTPRRFQCQPDLVDAAVDAVLDLSQEARSRTRDSERLRVRPAFNSVRYGTPDYCQLSVACAVEIAQGADDESEMGAFHDLYQPQRAAALRAGLDEYSPAGVDSAVIFAS